MISVLLVANRGEIAVRILGTARAMGLRTVAVYSDADRYSPHVALADVAVPLGGLVATESYLDIDKILDAAARTGSDAIHPGYGFLSESADFAQACADAAITFVGPSTSVIRAMGGKIEAKRIAAGIGAPILPGAEILGAEDDWSAAATQLGYPLVVKASAGGGGKGMRVVRSDGELAAAIESGRREAAASFGDATVFLERWLDSPRHIEVQVLADTHGNVLHLFERECSIQRRHQKIIEECPSPAVNTALREQLTETAVELARGIGYVGAGTVEFLVSGEHFYFLEMNTRLQVEHRVTEAVTGLDLVRLQLEIAAGARLPFEQSDVAIQGHAVEARIYAEDPANDFVPSSGVVQRFLAAAAPGVLYDSGVADGSSIPPYYDPMLVKVVAHGHNRSEATSRLRSALDGTVILGVRTNRSMLSAILSHRQFITGQTTTDFLEHHPELLDPETSSSIRAMHGVAVALVQRERRAAAHPLLRTVAAGWRNMGAGFQAVSFDGSGSTTTVEYRVASDGGLRLLLDGKELLGRLLSVVGDVADFELDGVRAVCTVTSVDGLHNVRGGGHQTELLEHDRFPTLGSESAARGPVAPMPGRVTAIAVTAGAHIVKGQLLVVVEAMKMEHRITSETAGIVREVLVTTDDIVDAHQLLILVDVEHAP